MKINNIKFESCNTINVKTNKIIIPLIIYDNKIDLFTYINKIIKTNETDFSKKIIKDIETKIVESKKNINSFNIILQTKETYYELIIIYLKIDSKLEKNKVLDTLRVLGSNITQNLIINNINKSNIYLLENEDEFNICFLEGFLMKFYNFNKYKTNEKSSSKHFYIVYKKNNNFNKKLDILKNNISSLFLAKDLINEPANKLTPDIFIKEIKNYIKINKLKIITKVYDTKELEKMGMNLIASVGKGSNKENQSKLLLLYYTGNKKKTLKKSFINNLKKIDYTLIGKGVLFDTGGISLKKTKKMNEMKYDMSGASIVSNFICGYAKNKGKKNILCLVPLVQNNISNNATIPGDIIKSYDGKTIEIVNTDAEGRLLIADCLSYVNKHLKHNKKMKIIDIATLTGQQENLSDGYFGNFITRHTELSNDIIDSGNYIGEKMVYLPYMTEFEDKLKSDTGDYKNVNEDMKSNLLLSTAFLGLFINPSFKWIHFDIAGPAFNYNKVKDYSSNEGSAFGLRLLFKMIK